MLSNANDPVNIGNPNEMTIEKIAKQIIQATNSQSKIAYRPLPTDDPEIRQPDITRAKTLFGWEPKISLDQGLYNTIDYFKRKIDL